MYYLIPSASVLVLCFIGVAIWAFFTIGLPLLAIGYFLGLFAIVAAFVAGAVGYSRYPWMGNLLVGVVSTACAAQICVQSVYFHWNLPGVGSDGFFVSLADDFRHLADDLRNQLFAFREYYCAEDNFPARVGFSRRRALARFDLGEFCAGLTSAFRRRLGSFLRLLRTLAGTLQGRLGFFGFFGIHGSLSPRLEILYGIREVPTDELRHHMVLPELIERRFHRIEKEFPLSSRLTVGRKTH